MRVQYTDAAVVPGSQCVGTFSELYAGRIQHHPDLATDGLRRQVSSESASDHTVGTVSSAYLAPVDSEFVAVPVCRFRLGDEGYPLAEVKLDVFLGIHALDFDQTNVVVLVTQATLVSKNGAIYMKTRGSGRHVVCLCVYIIW